MPTALENVFYSDTSVTANVGCTIEYNMNSMIDNVSVNYTSASYESLYKVVDGKNTFKKLFPIDSIVKPFRPVTSGIKYYIFLDNEHTAYPFDSLRKIDYSSAKPRVYYAGSQNFYKYWVTAQDQNMDLVVKYSQLTNTVTEAYSTGSQIVYTTQQGHGLITGQTISISGLSTSAFNLSNAVIASVPSTNTFTVNSAVTGTRVSGASATATLSAATKPALTNKIVIRFEKYHVLPTNCTVTITKEDGTTTGSPATITSIPSSGELILHYHGGTPSWQTSIAEPKTYADPVAIKSIRVQATNPGGGRVIGLIEVSARWVKDISSDIVSFEIQKESSSSSEDILPIGKVTSNSLSMSMLKYDETKRRIVEYNRSSVLDQTLIYMIKNAELRPYFKIYHSAATTVSGEYDKIYQGIYFTDSWNISDYGDTTLMALDGAKYLMETVAPERVFESYSVVSILRALLDSVGFSNYNFNYSKNGSIISDDSIPTFSYWWSDGTQTVWELIQELCRDIQMNAIFDNDGSLQFYSRNYIYDNSRSTDWEFYYDAESGKLPNIIDFNVKEIAAANQVKVIWSVPNTSDLVGNSSFLWSAPTTLLSAGALLSDGVTSSYPWIGDTIEMEISQLDSYSVIQSAFSFNGFFLIDSEIIEYDAIKYQYVSSITNNVEEEWVTSEADLSRIKSIAKGVIDYESVTATFSATIKPLSKYRIKKRGALGTVPAAHSKTSNGFSTGEWSAYGVTWQ